MHLFEGMRVGHYTAITLQDLSGPRWKHQRVLSMLGYKDMKSGLPRCFVRVTTFRRRGDTSIVNTREMSPSDLSKQGSSPFVLADEDLRHVGETEAAEYIAKVEAKPAPVDDEVSTESEEEAEEHKEPRYTSQ